MQFDRRSSRIVSSRRVPAAGGAYRGARGDRLKRAAPILGIMLACFSLAAVGFYLLSRPLPTRAEAAPIETPAEPPDMAPEPETAEAAFSLRESADTVVFADEDENAPQSSFVVLADAETGEILAERRSDERMYPASMTKVLTLLVAMEHLPEDASPFTMTRQVADYCYVNECSVVGYEVGEEIPARELPYGCILCSGADACMGLVQLCTDGSHEQFVEWMNEKAEELGISETSHFTNCVGLFDEAHYTTARDMATIMHAALADERCREIMSTKIFLSEPTDEHPEGHALSNWFIRRIDGQDTGGVNVAYGKTGYVPQSGNCVVSCGEGAGGRRYLCVTGMAHGSWQAIYDHAQLYREYAAGAGAPAE